MEDKGQQTLRDSQSPNGYYEGYRTHYKWDCGLVLRDWRYVSRVANIDVSDLTYNAATGAKLVDLIVQALEIIPNTEMGRTVIYCNRTVRSFLRRQMASQSNVLLGLEEVGGKHVLTFGGFPVKKCDSILLTESAVS